MRFATTFCPCAVLLLGVLASCCHARRRRLVRHRRRLAPGGLQESKTQFTGFTALAYLRWEADLDCVWNNDAYLTATEKTSKVGTNRKPQQTMFEDVFFGMSSILACDNDSFKYATIQMTAEVLEDIPDTDITIDAKLSSGIITSTGEADIIVTSCDYDYDAPTDSYNIDYCSCTDLSTSSEVIKIEAKLMGTGNAMPSKSSSSYRDSEGGYDYRFTGTSRDAVIVYMKVTRENGLVINIPVSGDTVEVVDVSLGKAKVGETEYFRN